MKTRTQLINDFTECFAKAIADDSRETRVIVETGETDKWGDERYYMIDTELGWLLATTDPNREPWPLAHELDTARGEWIVSCNDGTCVQTRNTGNVVCWAIQMIDHGRARRIYNDIY